MSESTSSPAEFNEALAYQEAEEEVQLWIGAYSPRMLLPALVIGLPITAVLFALARLSDPNNEGGFIRYSVEGALTVAWLAFLAFAFWRLLGTEFMLTNKRLYCRRGFGHPGLAGVNLENFLDVRVQQSGIDRRLRTGTVILTLRGQRSSNCKLKGIADPDRVASILRKQLRAIRAPEG